MGRRAAPVTQADISRAVRAVKDAGMPVIRVRIRPDGEVIVETVEAAPAIVDRETPQDANRVIFL